MEKEMRYALRYRRAAADLGFVAVLAIVNLVISLSGGAMYFFFAAFSPTAAFLYGKSIGIATGETLFITAGIFLSFCLCALYVYLWYKAKKNCSALAVAAALYGLDTVLIFVFSLLGYGTLGFIDTAAHLFITYNLCRGFLGGRALSRITRLDKTEVEALFRRLLENSEGEAPVNEENRDEPSPPLPESQPLRPAKARKRCFFDTFYEGMHIAAYRSFGCTELVINGYVYDEIRGIVEVAYRLEAVVSGHRVALAMEPGMTSADMVLYVDGKEIGRITRTH